MLYTKEQLANGAYFTVPAGGETYRFPGCAMADYCQAVADYVAEGFPDAIAVEMACCEVEADVEDSREVAARM